MIFELKYNFDIKYYKIFYKRPSLVDYVDNNQYVNNTKNRLSIISYIYYLNKITISQLNKKTKIIKIFLIEVKYIILNNISKQII